ncbi:hypothetical protein PCASD_09400 [Puccinia coronata f. sp. avenae]|uniref:DUF6589 domain-containing protein n=1 Tax=Puccinia coronata f. sp. avenae TaxID=200324 RepID=A0A2N5V1A7_9BASI|nr:hypothetical protein PCASD_09400 [Puccinia coronata f. sp. avenae]
MFLPTLEDEKAEVQVWKSQIAHVMLKLVSMPSEQSSLASMQPPVIELISPTKPNIHMLKLMDSSNNSAEGVGQVLQDILTQSGLTEDQFFNRLQPMDGDLGTVQNFNCLRSQRAPSAYAQGSLSNISFQLGAAHTLWNVGTSLFSHNYGNSSDSTDCGAWKYLEALGFPAEKAIQKKDFTLMVNQMEKVFEASIYYFLRVIIKERNQKLEEKIDKKLDKMSNKKLEEPRPIIPSKEWESIVNECYTRFCSSKARNEAALLASPKLHNTLVQLRDFSTVVEARRSMQAGDVGRLLLVWKKWCLMTQALSGCTNYSSYLPRQVLLLTQLPPDLAKFLRQNLLITPTGQPNHFQPKDFWLEIQNFWLKVFYNKTGNGTHIDRLKDMYSPNIMLLQSMFQSLKADSGSKIIYQSHKNTLSTRSLELFILMAEKRDILGTNPAFGLPFCGRFNFAEFAELGSKFPLESPQVRLTSAHILLYLTRLIQRVNTEKPKEATSPFQNAY